MRTAAILPVKSFSRAKRRLGESTVDPLRDDLARAMVGDVLVSLSATPGIELTIVVTKEPLAAAAARYKGAAVVEDVAEEGQSSAASLGVAHALEAGMDRVMCVPGDCPALDPAELAGLLTRSTGKEVVIVPDRHGTGTNGLLLSPPDAIAPSFGPGSCKRHEQLAQKAGVPCRIEHLPCLLLDVDTGEDLAALRARLMSAEGGAPRTRAALRISREQTWQASSSAA